MGSYQVFELLVRHSKRQVANVDIGRPYVGHHSKLGAEGLVSCETSLVAPLLQLDHRDRGILSPCKHDESIAFAEACLGIDNGLVADDLAELRSNAQELVISDVVA
jgi:hypothetical protein